VLQLIAEGKANKQIAAELGIRIKTVERHRQELMNRLGIHDVAGLTRYAISKGIIETSVSAAKTIWCRLPEREVQRRSLQTARRPSRWNYRGSYPGK
jgi:Bacterial regulatory proteins, luxR family